jgi:hypothetical protein
MLTCPKCKHSNFDGFAACSRCGAPLGAAGGGMPAGHAGGGGPVGPGGVGGGGGAGMDEYQRLMAARAAAATRNRSIIVVVLLVVGGGGGFFWWKHRQKIGAAQVVLEAGGKFAERDKAEMGAFWNCVTSSEIDVGSFQSADQIQQRVESAYFTQQKTFSDHLTTECVPKIERARAALGPLATEVPAEMKAPLDKYLASLPKMQAGIESYAEKIKGRGATKDVNQVIQEVAGAFSPDATPESVAFEKFLVCAIPDLGKKKDMQEVLQFLADTCKTDAVKFMTRVLEECGPLVQNIDKEGKPSPSKTFKVNAKKFYDEEARQGAALEYCAKRSRKGKKVLDLEEFLTASGDYIESRAEVAQAAKETAARITGQPLPAPKKKPGEAPEGEGPAPAKH